MSVASDYRLIAQVRSRQLLTRLAIAGVLAGAYMLVLPSGVCLSWFALVLAGQILDVRVNGRVLVVGGVEPSRGLRLAVIGSAFLNGAAYSAIAIPLWLAGDMGRVLAFTLTAGALLHVVLHLKHVRAVLFAAAAPPALYLLALPLAEAGLLQAPAGPAVIATVCAALYLAHLFGALAQADETTHALKRANDRAVAEQQRAERASAAKSDFLATISHEIRTPMNAVIAAGHLLRRSGLTARQRDHVDMLEQAGEVLIGLLSDVLDISKIEAGRMMLEEADVALAPKLEGLVALWRPHAEAKGLPLTLEIDPSLPEAIRSDPLRLQQVLFNLISNAVKFTEAGVIAIRAEAAGPSWFRVTVADTGCGISAAALARVFDSFEQADAGTTRRHGGTGLGLAISRRLAELMGGSLTARSVVGEGSSFTLELPLRIAERPASIVDAPVQRRDAEESGPLSILLAEDHEVNRRIVALLLEPTGARISVAENGAQAVEAAARQPFDAILMDMQMPVMDGLDATRAIRAGRGPNADTPILALTANAMDHHRAAWREVGVEAFLTKPIAPALLLEALANLPPREACAPSERAAHLSR